MLRFMWSVDSCVVDAAFVASNEDTNKARKCVKPESGATKLVSSTLRDWFKTRAGVENHLPLEVRAVTATSYYYSS